MTAARLDYCLDAGVEGFSEVEANMRTHGLHLALHYNRLPALPGTRAFDALKPIRAAAFAGFATDLEDQSVVI
ncbi:hypothetical protein Q2K19_21875 [Micromonospora soli]|uniref:hypothetical protein n=1 Tax=Micromonospora sp. NBRC 110009 TaxID=3061627 RepID=UPI002671B648|nr:hypothetical protein [Micromonospora sp. NBRC 110009]WKT96833.1 hypothetical protein Q2K19_21875 [Micromonospora sp. NBRC 110009]